MKIAIDIDNVITNTTECIVEYINERIPDINLKIEDITSYWIENCLPTEYAWLVDLSFHDPKMWKRVKLIDGAAEYIEKLYNDRHELYFATATTPENYRKKIGFLTRELSFLPLGYVSNNSINIKNKQLLDVDYLIDDYTQNLVGQRRYKSICFDYPWNKDCPYNEDTYERAKDWKEVYTIIKYNCPRYYWDAIRRNNGKGNL